MYNSVAAETYISISEKENQHKGQSIELQKKNILKIVIRVCMFILALWDFFRVIQMFFRVPTYCKSKLLTHFKPQVSFLTP